MIMAILKLVDVMTSYTTTTSMAESENNIPAT